MTIHGLALPSAHLVRLNLAMSRNLLDGLVATKRAKRDLGVESSRETASFRHLHTPSQRAEYISAYCPFSGSHLGPWYAIINCNTWIRLIKSSLSLEQILLLMEQ